MEDKAFLFSKPELYLSGEPRRWTSYVGHRPAAGVGLLVVESFEEAQLRRIEQLLKMVDVRVPPRLAVGVVGSLHPLEVQVLFPARVVAEYVLDADGEGVLGGVDVRAEDWEV